eukprot:gene61-12881_t
MRSFFLMLADHIEQAVLNNLALIGMGGESHFVRPSSDFVLMLADHIEQAALNKHALIGEVISRADQSKPKLRRDAGTHAAGAIIRRGTHWVAEGGVFDPYTLEGSAMIQLGQAAHIARCSGEAGVDSWEAEEQPPPVCMELGLEVPAEVRAVYMLRSMCEGRLLPTTWLNKYCTDELFLQDVPYQYKYETSKLEQEFPEFFRRQIQEKDVAAREAARVKHLEGLRLKAAPAAAAAHSSSWLH